MVELALNSAVQVSTGFSPAYMVFGQALRLPVDALVGSAGSPVAMETAQ